jgi:hypothetical protein
MHNHLLFHYKLGKKGFRVKSLNLEGEEVWCSTDDNGDPFVKMEEIINMK